MEALQEILKRQGLDTMSDMSQKDWEQFKVDDWNKTEGNENENDGYNCPICKNKGTIAKLVENNGWYSHSFIE